MYTNVYFMKTSTYNRKWIYSKLFVMFLWYDVYLFYLQFVVRIASWVHAFCIGMVLLCEGKYDCVW